MKEKISAAADALNAAETKKEIGGRSSGSRTKSKEDVIEDPNNFVKLGEFFGDRHNFKSSITVKQQRKRLLSNDDDTTCKMRISCNAVNYLSLAFNKEEVLFMLLNHFEDKGIEYIVKDIILKDDSILVILNKSEILKKREDNGLLDQSQNYIQRYLKDGAISDDIMALTVNGTLDSYGEEFAIEISVSKFIISVITPTLLPDVEDIRPVVKRWTLGEHEVRNDVMAICYIITPSDNFVEFNKKNFVGLQATVQHSLFSELFDEAFKIQKDENAVAQVESKPKVVFKRISNVLNNVPKSSSITKYVLKGSDSSAEITCVPLIEFNKSLYEVHNSSNSTNWFLRSLSAACNTTKQLNEREIRKDFFELINDTVVIFGVEGENKSFLLPDIYKVSQVSMLGKIDPTLKTSVRVNDSLISMTLHI